MPFHIFITYFSVYLHDRQTFNFFGISISFSTIFFLHSKSSVTKLIMERVRAQWLVHHCFVIPACQIRIPGFSLGSTSKSNLLLMHTLGGEQQMLAQMLGSLPYIREPVLNSVLPTFTCPSFGFCQHLEKTWGMQALSLCLCSSNKEWEKRWLVGYTNAQYYTLQILIFLKKINLKIIELWTWVEGYIGCNRK